MQSKQEQGHAESAATLQMVPLKLGYDWFLERVRTGATGTAQRAARMPSCQARGCVGA